MGADSQFSACAMCVHGDKDDNAGDDNDNDNMVVVMTKKTSQASKMCLCQITMDGFRFVANVPIYICSDVHVYIDHKFPTMMTRRKSLYQIHCKEVKVLHVY